MSNDRIVTPSEPAVEASPPSVATLVNEVARGLGLRVAEADAEYMFGEIDGSPASMTVLGARPLSLLLAFRIAPGDDGAEPTYLPEGIAALAAQGRAKVSIEDDYAWLTLYGLDGRSAGEIRDFVQGFAAAIKKAGLALPPGCAKCGVEEGAELFFHGSTCSRLCRSCVERLFLDRHSAQRRIEAARLSYAFLVPPALLVIAAGWTVFYCLVDFLIRWFKVKVVVIDGEWGFMVLLALLAVCGVAFGYPLGRCVGRLRLHPALGYGLAILACIAGEFLYVAASVSLRTGVLDFRLAAQVFPAWLKRYDAGWIIGKLLLCGSVALGTYVGTKGAAERKEAPLRL